MHEYLVKSCAQAWPQLSHVLESKRVNFILAAILLPQDFPSHPGKILRTVMASIKPCIRI